MLLPDGKSLSPFTLEMHAFQRYIHRLPVPEFGYDVGQHFYANCQNIAATMTSDYGRDMFDRFAAGALYYPTQHFTSDTDLSGFGGVINQGAGPAIYNFATRWEKILEAASFAVRKK